MTGHHDLPTTVHGYVFLRAVQWDLFQISGDSEASGCL
jgi:hypothetical protein